MKKVFVGSLAVCMAGTLYYTVRAVVAQEAGFNVIVHAGVLAAPKELTTKEMTDLIGGYPKALKKENVELSKAFPQYKDGSSLCYVIMEFEDTKAGRDDARSVVSTLEGSVKDKLRTRAPLEKAPTTEVKKQAADTVLEIKVLCAPDEKTVLNKEQLSSHLQPTEGMVDPLILAEFTHETTGNRCYVIGIYNKRSTTDSITKAAKQVSLEVQGYGLTEKDMESKLDELLG